MSILVAPGAGKIRTKASKALGIKYIEDSGRKTGLCFKLEQQERKNEKKPGMGSIIGILYIKIP